MTAKMDLEPLRRALPMRELCERHGLVFRRAGANLAADCPFHEGKSKKPTFTIHAGDDHAAFCYSCRWGGDIMAFHSERRGVELKGREFLRTVEELHALAGLIMPSGELPPLSELPKPKIPRHPSILERRPPVLPELSPLSDHCLRELAELRGYSVEGLREATRRGFLHYGDWPVDRESRPTSRSCASWCLTDSSRRTAQFRRLDGRPYPVGGDPDGIKAWSTRGVNWMIGCQDVTPETELVLLVEGGADLLAAWTLIERHAAALSPAPSLAVCCVFGGGVHIAPECLALLSGKRVRIVMDIDGPRTLKRKGREILSRAGTETAAEWSRELTEAGAFPEVYSLEGLTCRKGGEERPVGDLNDLLLMEDADLRTAIVLQLLSPSPAAPLPGESAPRTGAVPCPAPGTAADFIPFPVPTPFTMTNTAEPATAAPSSSPQDTAAPPSTEDLIERNRRAAVERVRQKLNAGMHLGKSEIAILREDDRLRAVAATVIQSPAGADGTADPVPAVCEFLNVWWVNGSGGVFQVGNNHRWREMPREDLYAMLQEQGISNKPVGNSLLEQNRRCVLHIMNERMLDRAIDGLAGFRPGIHDFKSVRILVRKGPLVIRPLPGDCHLIETILMGALGLDGVEGAASMVQYERFNYWLARAARNVHQPGKFHLNSQIMMLAGPGGAGKSLLQHLIITPILGGRSADPSRYLFGETSFNEGWVACEHLLIEDPRPNVRTHDRLIFAQMLKALSVNQEHSLHGKGKSEFTVPARFVVSLTINDDPDSIRILPKLTPDFLDKVILLKVRPYDLPMPADSAEEKAAFQEAVAAQLPAYLDYLFSLEVPEKLRDPRKRFGVLHYRNPDLALMLSEDTPESELLALLDHALIRPESMSGLDRTLWECGGAHDPREYLEKHPRLSQPAPLQLLSRCVESKRRFWMGTAQQLSDLMERCASARSWRKIIDHNQLSKLLARLEQDRPDRVCAHHARPEGAPATQSKQRFWIIAASIHHTPPE